MRILVIEDDKKIGSFVVNGLRQAGFAIDHAIDAARMAFVWPCTSLTMLQSLT